MDDIVMRATSAHDAQRIADIWIDAAEYYRELDPRSFTIPSREDVERVPVGDTADGELSLVAEVDGTVAGFVNAHIEAPGEESGAQFVSELAETRLIVDALVVERRHWRRGVGGALLRAAEEWGRAREATVSCLDTYERSPVSVAFYEHRMGYERKSINLRKSL